MGERSSSKPKKIKVTWRKNKGLTRNFKKIIYIIFRKLREHFASMKQWDAIQKSLKTIIENQNMIKENIQHPNVHNSTIYNS